MTLVARSCRTSLAPGPLRTSAFAAARDVTNIVATGEHDVFLPPARLLAPTALQLHTRLRVLPGTGHLATDENPRAIGALVAEVAHGAAGRR